MAIDGDIAMTDQDSASKVDGAEAETPEDVGQRTESESETETATTGGDASSEGSTEGAEEAPAEGVEFVEEVVEEDPLALAREENKKVREQLLRLAADFDNFRKRARRENEDAIRRAKMDVLRDLLPVFDNMERAGAHAEQAADLRAVATGVSMVVRQFEDTIGKLGVERVKSVGEVFDPNVHEAIQLLETAEQTPGTVMAEVLGGYRWGDRLLRAAMVVVAKAPAVKEPEGEADGSVQGPTQEPVEGEGLADQVAEPEETQGGVDRKGSEE
jgi:molecular chaperone GrpE